MALLLLHRKAKVKENALLESSEQALKPNAPIPQRRTDDNSPARFRGRALRGEE
jgi:hypothetical protein